MTACWNLFATRQLFVTKERPFDFIYDICSKDGSAVSYQHNMEKPKVQPKQIRYIPIYPHMFTCLPKYSPRYYAPETSYFPHNMKDGKQRDLRNEEADLNTIVRGIDRWRSYKRPHLPFYDGPVQYLDHQYPRSRCGLVENQESTEPEEDDQLGPSSRTKYCQTDYRVQSAQTDPAELGTILRDAFQELDTIYPRHTKPFTEKTITLVKRGIRRRELKEISLSIDNIDDPQQQMNQYASLEKEKWEYIGAEMQEAMEDRMVAFRETIAESQQYLRHRIQKAQKELQENQRYRFDEQMAVVWYDVNIWRRFHYWTRAHTHRKILRWQTNPPDIELLKEVPDAFAHDARRYVPRTNQGDFITGLTWNNKPDYFLDTWEGFSQVLENMDPKHLHADILIPLEEKMFDSTGYVKRKFKEAARFDQISFTFNDADYDDLAAVVNTQATKKKPPALLRTVTTTKQQKKMLRVPPIDDEKIAAFRAGVTIQKLVRGRGLQKTIHAGLTLRKELIEEVRGNVALTDGAKADMKARYVEYLNRGRVLLFHRYRMRFIDNFLSTIEAQVGTERLRESHFTLVRHLEFEAANRFKRFALAQRRMREAREAGRRQQEYRRYVEKEETVQLFQINHHVSAARTVQAVVKATEDHLASEAYIANKQAVWSNVEKAQKNLVSALNQQENETFIASMIYSVMIPDVQRRLVREAQNEARASRRLAIHQALFESFAALNRENPTRETSDEKKPKSGIKYPKILPELRRPTHRLDKLSYSYRKYAKRRHGFFQSIDTEYNFNSKMHRKQSQPDRIGLHYMRLLFDTAKRKVADSSTVQPSNEFRKRRRRSLLRFDRIDRDKIRRIVKSKRQALTPVQQEDLREIIEEPEKIASEVIAPQKSKLKRRRARVRSYHLWGETERPLQEQVSVFPRNSMQSDEVPPLRLECDRPQADVHFNTASYFDVSELVKIPAVTVTAHTTGAPEPEADDVVVNELSPTECIPKPAPSEEYLRKRFFHSKLNV